MKLWKWLIVGSGAAATLAAIWIVSQQPSHVEMAKYVPAETLAYLEADDLPEVLAALTGTDAWRSLAPSYGVDRDYGSFGWLSQTLANANLGSTETIIFGRAQIAVALMGIGAADAGAKGENLKIRPQFAVVVETKSSRTERFVEKQIGDFARKQFGSTSIEKKAVGEATWTVFRSKTDERNLFAAIQSTVVIVGNEESAVQACLDAQNGERKSLADDANLAKMRTNTESETAFAFSYVSPEGVRQLSNVASVLAANQIIEDPRAMSLLAQSLPPFVQKSVTAIGWTARRSDGQIEDRFFVQMPPDLIARLREPLAAQARNDSSPAAALLPDDLQSIAVYNFKNSQAAWRGVIFAMTTKLDMFGAAALSQTAGGLLEPYGVEKADLFLGATNGAISTVRLSAADNSTVTAVNIKDAVEVKKSLRVDDETKSEFIKDFLLLGGTESLQACRTAQEQNRTFNNTAIWLKFADAKLTPGNNFLRTLTRDEAASIDFVKLFAKDKNKLNVVAATNDDLAPEWSWTMSETGLVREGIERRTLSAFGTIGTLATTLTEK